jgi:hypothetical protein
MQAGVKIEKINRIANMMIISIYSLFDFFWSVKQISDIIINTIR